MYDDLLAVTARPEPFEFYTAGELWADEYTSRKMLEFHLNEEVDISSRNSAFIDRSVDWIVDHFGVREGTKIADFGCGPGLYSTRLALAGADVTGIDLSPRSIDYAQGVAQEKGLSVRYVQQDYLQWKSSGKVDLVLMIMCDFCALSPEQRRQLLNTYHNLLYPGGSVLLDVYSIQAFERREEVVIFEKNLMNGFWSPDSYFGFLVTHKYDAEHVVLDKYTIIEADRTRTIYNWLQYFSRESLLSELIEAGFELEGLYANVAGALFGPNTNEFAVVARKK